MRSCSPPPNGRSRPRCPPSDFSDSRTTLPTVVSIGGARSAPFEFTAVRPSGDVFRPRFVAVPAPGGDPERHAVVGTEIGPVLVLSGRADAASTAERAARVAAQLNTLLQAAASRPVPVEVKDGAVAADHRRRGDPSSPSPPRTRRALRAAGTACRGRASPLRRWPGTGRRCSTTTSACSASGSGRIALIELTPRARVLLDLYSDAERRGGSAGVGMGIVVRAGTGPARRPPPAGVLGARRGPRVPRDRPRRRMGGQHRGRRPAARDPPRGPPRRRSPGRRDDVDRGRHRDGNPAPGPQLR